MLTIRKASEMTHTPNLAFLVYGDPKVGKSTFAIKGGKVLIGDCEGGYRFMGGNEYDGDVAEIKNWNDLSEFKKMAESGSYDLVVIDPINEILDKLIDATKATKNKRYTVLSAIGANKEQIFELSLGGWGFVKTQMKRFISDLKMINKNVLFIAHVKEEEYEGVTKKAPKLDANLAKELMAKMDVIGYMRMANVEGKKTRVINFETSETFEAGDRTSTLPSYILADGGFKDLYKTITKNKKYKATESKEEEKDVDVDTTPIVSEPEEAPKKPVNKTTKPATPPVKQAPKEGESAGNVAADPLIKKEPDVKNPNDMTVLAEHKNEMVRLAKMYLGVKTQADLLPKIKDVTGLEITPSNLEKINNIIKEKLKNGTIKI